MRLKCSNLSVMFSYDGGSTLTLQLAPESVKAAREAFDELKGCTISVDLAKWRDKRSIDANSYYWSLLNKLARALKISTNFCHNVMLRRYGTLEELDGTPIFVVIPDTDEAERSADESEKYHIKPTSNVRDGNDGKRYRTYLVLKGSHDYDTAEMSALISGIRDECQQCGIPVETPKEIAQFLSLAGEA